MIGRSTNQTCVRSFIGDVTFYKSMWPRWSHVLAPLHELTGVGRFMLGQRQEIAVLAMNTMLAADTMSYYPDLNKPFDIYTDASKYQMGTVIIKDGHPNAYWSKKHTDSQGGYDTIEKELLAVMMCMKKYHNILYFSVINVYTDHKNLTFCTLSAPRVLWWKLFPKQYNIYLTYVPGKVDVLAACFLRLNFMNDPLLGKNEGKRKIIDYKTLFVPKNKNNVFISSTGKELPTLLPPICGNEDVDTIELFMNLSALSEMTCPLTLLNIQQRQVGDQVLVQTALVQFHHYPIKMVNCRKLVCYCPNPNVVDEDDWKVYLPQSMLQDVIWWYHMILVHPGVTQVYDTIQARFHAKRLSVDYKNYVCPNNTHKYKQQTKECRKLSPYYAEIAPWNEVCLIGPWKK